MSSSSFRSMKYQILAAAALLLSGPYITAAADPADQAQWSESIPLGDGESPFIGPGERIEAYIVDGLLHVRSLDSTDIPLWHLILAEADPNQPPTLGPLGINTPIAIEVRHANGMYFVRDSFQSFPSTLAAHRQQLSPEAFASLDTTVRQNGIDPSGYSYWLSVSPDKLQEIPLETFAIIDSTVLAGVVQQLGPEAFASLDTTTLALLKKRVPEAFASFRQRHWPEFAHSDFATRHLQMGERWTALGSLGTEQGSLGYAHPPDSDAVRAGKAVAWRFRRRSFFETGTMSTSGTAAEC